MMMQRKGKRKTDELSEDDVNRIASQHVTHWREALSSDDLPQLARLLILSGEISSALPQVSAHVESDINGLVAEANARLASWKKGLVEGDLFEVLDLTGSNKDGTVKVHTLKVLRNVGANKVFAHYQVTEQVIYILFMYFFSSKHSSSHVHYLGMA